MKTRRAVVAILIAVVLAAPARPASPEAELFAHLGGYIRDLYFDPDRVRPRRMLESALLDLESAAEEIYVEREGEGEGPSAAWRVQVHDRAYRVPPSATHDLASLTGGLARTLAFVRRNYAGEAEIDDIEYAAANGMLRVLDPHTNVFSKKQYDEFFVHIQGEIYGVGMYVGVRDGKLTVIAPLKDTPAWRAGLRAKDHIVKIDDESTVSMTTPEAVTRIRGPEGTTVKLTVLRKGEKKPRVFEVKRARVAIKSVESTFVEPGLAYIKVVTFSHTTLTSLRGHLERLAKAPEGIRRIILDLRDNSGGLLDQAVKACDLFLESGDVVLTARRGRILSRLEARDDGDEIDVPLVVLVNQGTASGAEIVAGALQKNDRALVVGERTFGKGTVQQLRQLDSRGAQIKITVSEYLLPESVSIQETGVTPNVELLPVRITEDFIDFDPDALRFREKDYESTVRSRFARDEKPDVRMRYFEPEPEEGEVVDPFVTSEFDFDRDPPVRIAASLLALFRPGDRPSTVLRERKAGIEAIRERLLGRIAEALAKRDIDWSAGLSPEGAAVSVALAHDLHEEPSEDEADPTPARKLTIRATLENRSQQTLYRVRGDSDSDYDLYKGWEFLFGRVEPGRKVTREVTIDLSPYYTIARRDPFRLRILDGADRELATARAEIELPRVPRPTFAFRLELLDAASRKPIDRVRPGTEAILRARIENKGPGTCFQGIAILKNELEKERARDVFLRVGRQPFRNLAPGEHADVEFSFQVQEDAAAEACAFKFIVSDAHVGPGQALDVQIPARPDATTAFRSGKSFVPPRITALALGGAEPESRLVTADATLPIRIGCRSGSSAIRNVMAFRAADHRRDKVLFRPVDREGAYTLPGRIRVERGINFLTVIVTGADGLQAARTFVVRRPVGAQTVRRAE